MFATLISRLLSKQHQLKERKFDVKMLKQEVWQSTIEKQGYIHLKNVVDIKHIQELINVFDETNQKFNLIKPEEPYFLNTMALESKEPKRFIQEKTMSILNKILNNILFIDNIKTPFGGAFCINPPHTKRLCKSHQDPAYVDETKTYSLIVWIPLMDINETNGRIHVLPKSHLWGNSCRAISMVWAFEPFSDELLKAMTPIDTKLGDMIIFDGAIIHASNANQTDKLRLAINIPVLPIQERMITYFKIGKDVGYKYEIDESYYLDEFLFDMPSNVFTNNEKVKLNNRYSVYDVHSLIERSKLD